MKLYHAIGWCLFFCTSLSGVGLHAQKADADWQWLFNGRDLKGWTTYGGQAPYIVRDSAIVGTSIKSPVNTFLCTDKPYGDFILELEYKLQAPLNSGVQIRSHDRPENGLKRIYGYQVEFDPSARAYTGGIYDEARRFWIYPLSYNKPAQSAYRHGAWTKLRVEAIGTRIRTYINGVPVTNLVDDADASGMICLQVHGVGSPDEIGLEVAWRDLRIRTGKLTEADMWPTTAPEVNLIPNTLTETERRQGWRLLWDGSTTQGWRGAKLDRFPDKGWQIENGVLTVLPSGGGESSNGGDIITENLFSDFELSFEFLPTTGANSGVKYFVDPELNKGPGSAIGLEFQILDDKEHPDAKMGVAGNRTVGSLYDLIPARVLDVPGRGKDIFMNAWNRGRIIARGGKVEHWLNGYKVVEYDRFSQMFEALVNTSKYKDWPNFGRWPQGHILLQDHGNKVSFRSIKIREF